MDKFKQCVLTPGKEPLDECDNDILSGKKIRCKICNKPVEQLSGHIVKIHNITINEYKDKYPNSPTVAPMMHELMVQRNHERHSVPGYSKMIGEKTRNTLEREGGNEKISKAKVLYHFNKRWNNITDKFIDGDSIHDFTDPQLWIGCDDDGIIWRDSIFERDNWTCQICYNSKQDVQAHHIKMRSKHPELVFDMDNGITLCIDCHKETFGKEDLYIDFLNKRVI